MAQVIEITGSDGAKIQFIDEVKASGAMKDVYFSPDRRYVVAFYRGPVDPAGQERLAVITGLYRERIFQQQGGDYWQRLFCWPTQVVHHDGRTGIVAPFYQPCFFFQHGSVNNDALGIRGKEKQGKWFASATLRNRHLAPQERGHWLNYLRIALLVSRAVRRMHAAGLAHSDLSYKNVLIDPVGGNACIIDVDGLVVPGKYPPEVAGTPDFIAPEVIMTGHLPRDDPQRKLPSILTDRHALAVLVYMYLLVRHPLDGGKVHDADDPVRDAALAMGEGALFVEHPADRSNRIHSEQIKPAELPWKDTGRLPYTITGPYLAQLFEHAFIDGLHHPDRRPTADAWEHALIKTVDLIQPCANPACEQQWYVFDNTARPHCPFCATPCRGVLPVLNLYSRRGDSYTPDNHRLMVYPDQSLFRWHVNRLVKPDEKLPEAQRRRVGYFLFHNDKWLLVNEALPELMDADTRTPVPVGSGVELGEGRKLLLSREPGGRLAVVQLVMNR